MLAHAVLPSEGRWALDLAERTFTRADAFAVRLVRDLERCAAAHAEMVAIIGELAA